MNSDFCGIDTNSKILFGMSKIEDFYNDTYVDAFFC